MRKPSGQTAGPRWLPFLRDFDTIVPWPYVPCSYIPSILILIFFPIFFYFWGPAHSPSSQPERWPRLFTQIRTVVLPQLPRDYNDAIGHAENSVHHYSLCCANLSTFFRKTGGKKRGCDNSNNTTSSFQIDNCAEPCRPKLGPIFTKVLSSSQRRKKKESGESCLFKVVTVGAIKRTCYFF